MNGGRNRSRWSGNIRPWVKLTLTRVVLAVIFIVGSVHAISAQESVFPQPHRAEDGTVLAPSRGALVGADDISSGICNRAKNSNVKVDDDLYSIEHSLFLHAQTSETDPNRNEKVRQWWVRAMPYINCYGRVYNGFEGGSPLNLMAYAGYGRQIIYLMRKYELPPEYMVYPHPRTGLNLFEWMEERVERGNYSEVATERIARELRLLTRWFTRIGYFDGRETR